MDDKELRIGIIVPGFSADADDWCIPALRHLVQRLAVTDEVRVLALRYPYRAGRYEVFGAQVTALGGAEKGGWGSLGVWRSVLATLASEHRRRRFDVLHAFWANETGMLAALAGRLLRAPALVSLAGGELVGFRDIGYGGQLAPSERMKVRLALRLASGVTAGSQALLERAGTWLPGLPAHQPDRVLPGVDLSPGGRPRRGAPARHRLHRVPLGVDLDLFRPPATIPRERTVRLIHVASLTPVKGQGTLLEAAARLQEGRLPFRLEIIGSGPLEPHLRTLATRLGLGEGVVFRGEVRHDQLPPLYGAGTAFVLSSRHEAQGMAPLEAAACGVPVIGTRVGIIPELAPGGAVCLPVGDPRALADAVLEVVSDSGRRTAMAAEARELVEEDYGVERCAQRFREIYTKLTNG